MKKFSFIILVFTLLNSFGQNYKGTILPVTKDGLHKILLPSEVRAVSDKYFNFLRIKDADANQVPYVLIYNTDRSFSTFTPIEILSRKSIKDSITSIVLDNKEAAVLEHVTLEIANTKIKKFYNVYGSDDATNWFGLVENRSCKSLFSSKETSFKKTINFPLNSYKFIRVDFNDKRSLPINILGAGLYKNDVFIQKSIKIEDYTQETLSIKNRKITQIKFTANKAHAVNTISFKVNTPYFLRNTKVFVPKKREVKKRLESYNQLISKFQLNSKNNNTFVFNALKAKEFIIEIDNQDNPALEIESIQLYQKPIHIVANLEQNKAYSIVIDSTLTKPHYDLGNFISNNTNAIAETTITNFNKLEKKESPTNSKSFWQTSLFMWICIVLGGVLVVYFALSLLKDIGGQK